MLTEEAGTKWKLIFVHSVVLYVLAGLCNHPMVVVVVAVDVVVVGN